MLELGMLEVIEGHYDKALWNLLNCDCDISNNQLLLFLCKENNVFVNKFYHNYYTINQLANYSVDEAISHILRHTEDDETKDKHTVFHPYIDIEVLMDYVQNHLTNENRIQSRHNFIIDSYIIPIKDIGTNNEDLLKVITIRGTKDILTMFPYKEGMIDEEYIEDSSLSYQKIKKLM